MAYDRLGQILDKRGKGDEAQQAYAKGAQLDPHDDDMKKTLK